MQLEVKAYSAADSEETSEGNMTKPQPWPIGAESYVDIILSQNDTLILSSLICHKRLRNESLEMLKGLLPDLIDGVKTIYEAAVQLGPLVENRASDKYPLWAQIVNQITEEYPILIIQLRALQSKIPQQRMDDIRAELAEVINTAARVQVKLMRVPGASESKQVLLLQAFRLGQLNKIK